MAEVIKAQTSNFKTWRGEVFDPQILRHRVIGTQRTGIVHLNGRLEALRHPETTEDRIHREYDHEASLATLPGDEHSRQHDQEIYEKLKSSTTIEKFVTETGAFGIGAETEAIITNDDGSMSKEGLGELTKGQTEIAHPVANSPGQVIDLVSQWVKDNPQALCVSVPISAKAGSMEVNAEGEVGDYVNFIQGWLLNQSSRSISPRAYNVWDQIALNEGFSSTEELFAQARSLAPWCLCAGHKSYGLAHFENDGQRWVSTKTAVSVSDLFASRLALPMSFMSASGPMAYGVVANQDGMPVRDFRLAARGFLPTAEGQIKPMLTEQEYFTRVMRNMIRGSANTIGRAAYDHVVNGRRTALMHYMVRTRLETHVSQIETTQAGRIEAVGQGETPDLVSKYYTTTYGLLIHALGHYASANNFNAYQLAEATGINSAGRFDHLEDLHDFNTRRNPEKTAKIIEDGQKMCEFVGDQMPMFYDYANSLYKHLSRLKLSPAQDLQDYLNNPRGFFADAIYGHISTKTADPRDLTFAILEFQQSQLGGKQ